MKNFLFRCSVRDNSLILLKDRIKNMNIEEFNEKLTNEQRKKIILELQMKSVPYSTAQSWMNGTRTPYHLVQPTICAVIQDVTGKKVDPAKLWPAR